MACSNCVISKQQVGAGLQLKRPVGDGRSPLTSQALSGQRAPPACREVMKFPPVLQNSGRGGEWRLHD